MKTKTKTIVLTALFLFTFYGCKEDNYSFVEVDNAKILANINVNDNGVAYGMDFNCRIIAGESFQIESVLIDGDSIKYFNGNPDYFNFLYPYYKDLNENLSLEINTTAGTIKSKINFPEKITNVKFEKTNLLNGEEVKLTVDGKADYYLTSGVFLYKNEYNDVNRMYLVDTSFSNIISIKIPSEKSGILAIDRILPVNGPGFSQNEPGNVYGDAVGYLRAYKYSEVFREELKFTIGKGLE